MNSPELSWGACHKSSPRVHHTNVITDNEITFLPRMVVAHSSIVHQALEHFFHLFGPIFDVYIAWIESSLIRTPYLVLIQARRVGPRLPRSSNLIEEAT